MNAPSVDQPSYLHMVQRHELDLDLNEFMIDRRSRNLRPKTMRWYSQSLAIFRAFLATQEITDLADVTAGVLRRFLVDLTERGHNAGGLRNIFGAVRAWLLWFGQEHAPEGWSNPLRGVKSPRATDAPMEPISLETVKALLATCDRTFTGERDRAIIMALLDTGCRASEFCAIDLADLNPATGAIVLRSEHTKSRRDRLVFLGARTLKQVHRYLRRRAATCPALWITEDGRRLTYSGLRQIMRRRSALASIPVPSLHSFRRAFALMSLRAGMDVYSLQRLMGHADLSVLRRYLAQTEADLKAAHERAGPVDRLL